MRNGQPKVYVISQVIMCSIKRDECSLSQKLVGFVAIYLQDYRLDLALPASFNYFIDGSDGVVLSADNKHFQRQDQQPKDRMGSCTVY
jgi:hypothetical protein